MLITLDNKIFITELSIRGAELQNLVRKSDKKDIIWQNTSGTPEFVCLEPWQGLTDAENTGHKWNNKA